MPLEGRWEDDDFHRRRHPRDFHDLWTNPDDPSYLVVANDGAARCRWIPAGVG